jgi:hypothetical protein
MKKIVLPIIFAIIVYSSCTERVDIELDSSYNRLVVEGIITTDTTAHLVRLEKTIDYFNNTEVPMVTGANVTITDNLGNVTALTEKSPGNYFTPPDFFGVIGRKYELEITGVDVDGNGENEFYRASSVLKGVPAIDSIHIKYREYWTQLYEIGLYAYEPEETRDFYMFKLYKNGKLISDTITEFSLADDLIFNGNYMWGVGVYFLNQDKEDEVLEIGDRLTLEMSGIPEDYYKFLIEAADASFGENPLFGGPPANVYSNISGDALGYFTAYSSYRISRIFMGGN